MLLRVRRILFNTQPPLLLLDPYHDFPCEDNARFNSWLQPFSQNHDSNTPSLFQLLRNLLPPLLRLLYSSVPPNLNPTAHIYL